MNAKYGEGRTARPPLHILQQPIELYHSSVRYHSLNG
jgi:hypothetical protein